LLRNDGGLVDAPGSWLAGTKREYPLRPPDLLAGPATFCVRS